jgi:methionine sulfoxide reductase heme-binding subunit
VPLAWTSSKQAVQRLTFPIWQRLHRLVYVVALLALLHFYLRVKVDHTQPWLYAAVVALGFVVRLVAWRAKLRSKRVRMV